MRILWHLMCLVIASAIYMPEAAIGQTAKKAETPALITALDRREFDKAKSLILNGANPNCKDAEGTTALMYATFRNRPELVELLIARGARVNEKDADGSSALLTAVFDRHPDIALLLLKHGADPNVVVKGGLSPITAAITGGHTELIGPLIDKGVTIDTPGRRGDTPLMTALRKANRSAADMLVLRGASVNVKNKDGETPLMLAARQGDVDLLNGILVKGGDVKAADADGRTALMYAVDGGALACVNALLKAGADAAVRDKRARGAIMYAHGASSGAIVTSLVAKGADINCQDSYGCSALMRAAQRNDEQTARALLDHAADLGAKDKQGRTALVRAGALGNTAVWAALSKPGAKQNPEKGRTALLKDVLRASIARLEYSSFKFRDQVGGTCFSCHNQSLAQLALRAARDKGFVIDSKNIVNDKAAVYSTYAKCAPPMVDSIAAGKGLANKALNQYFPGGATHIGYGLLGLDAWDQKPDSTTETVARYLPLFQQKDGHWRTQCTVRAPAEKSDFTETAFGIYSLKKFVRPEHAASVQTSIASAREWLARTEPKTTEDKTFLLLGLAWSGLGTDDKQVKEAIALLRSEQREDGGWAQEAGMESDAYATGEVLYALHRAGAVPTTDPAYRKGVNYLLRTVEEDGTWFVRSRSVPFQGYIDTGFPYRQDQFISITASCWATIAIADELPPTTKRTARKP